MMAPIRYWLGALEAIPALAIGWILVFVVPFRWTARWFGGATTPLEYAPAGSAEVIRALVVVKRLKRVAARLPWISTCLVRALAGSLLLQRRGIAATIRFGVSKTQTGLAAHAWLIVGDTTVLGGEDAPDYRPLADLGSNGR